jgi:hypothetical protein
MLKNIIPITMLTMAVFLTGCSTTSYNVVKPLNTGFPYNPKLIGNSGEDGLQGFTEVTNCNPSFR